MKTFSQSNPEVKETFFQNGNFAISRAPIPFSSMGMDQCHERLNELAKGNGGAVSLTEDESKLCKWMICRPEVARAVTEFGELST